MLLKNCCILTKWPILQKEYGNLLTNIGLAPEVNIIGNFLNLNRFTVIEE
jgi:hypothetical protein